MTLDEAIKRYTNNAKYERTDGSLQGCLEFKQLAEWLKDYKRLKEQEPCEDCISRQAVIDMTGLSEWFDSSDSYNEFVIALSELPPATPQPKTGHWVFDEVLDRHYYCSECKSMGVDYWDYCPNCGAKMVEEDKS